jgi:hypothetical protein
MNNSDRLMWFFAFVMMILAVVSILYNIFARIDNLERDIKILKEEKIEEPKKPIIKKPEYPQHPKQV